MKAPKTPVQFDSSKRKDIVIHYKAKNTINQLTSFGIHVKCMLKAGLSSLECWPGDCYILKIASV